MIYTTRGIPGVELEENLVRLTDDGQKITPVQVDALMSPDQQCGGTEEAKKESQEQGQLFKIINQNIMKYNEILEELQKYNLDMNARSSVNIKKVRSAVDTYHNIVNKISAYRDDGTSLLDSKKVDATITSRKADNYIYIVWLVITVIVVTFSILAMYRLK